MDCKVIVGQERKGLTFRSAFFYEEYDKNVHGGLMDFQAAEAGERNEG